jgi:hypothetical protein
MTLQENDIFTYFGEAYMMLQEFIPEQSYE